MGHRKFTANQVILLGASCLAACWSLGSSTTVLAQDARFSGSQTITSRYLGTDVSTSGLRDAGRHLAAVAARANPAVVHIESKHQTTKGVTEETGSGVIATRPASGRTALVITNRHVVANAALRQIEIRLYDGRVVFPVEKIEDPDSDLAVLKIPDVGVDPLEFADSDNLEIGHFVLAMGSPLGLSQSVTLGIVSAKARRALDLPGRRVINQDFIQTDAAINPGNSGGPLIDLDGRIIGINTAIASQGGGNEGIGFSIPSNLVQFIVDQLLTHGHVRRGYLGVELDQNYDLETARRNSLQRLYGARVTVVIDKTPAANAGLRAGDIILNLDGVEIEDENDLINRVSLTPVNKQVRMIVMRSGRMETLFVTLSERPTDERSELPQQMQPAVPALEEYRNASLKAQSLSKPLMRQLGYNELDSGLVVMECHDSTEANALQLYDVVLEVGRESVSDRDDLETALHKLADAVEVVVKVHRIEQGRAVTKLIVCPVEDLRSVPGRTAGELKSF
ncbi:MAG: trypsin-like peptidase domain-containing protein [Planctomycetaceae bacterium]|nr:trypsin-like peptidase domain-containing protein [Planctomycetaceae bacterium]